jgi:hypothetical protein
MFMEDPNPLTGLDLSTASREVIGLLIEDASDTAIFDEIVRVNQNRHEILELLLHHPETPVEVQTQIADMLTFPRTHEVRPLNEKKPVQAKPPSLLQRIQTLSVGERLQLAMKGGREIRGILIKDTNKEVLLGVLENQKITESEIEMIAKSRSVPEEAFRRISKNREWLQNYAIAFALVTNPKTPPGIAVGLVSGLKTKDLVILEKNKNVPELVRSAAKRLLSVRKPK